MKERTLRAVLDLLTCLARLLPVWPAYLFCFMGLLDRRGDPLVPLAAASFAFAFLALLITRVAQLRLRRRLTLRLLQAGLALVSAGCGFALCWALIGPGWQLIYAAILPAALAVLGCVYANVRLHRFEFFLAAGVYLATAAILGWRGASYSVTALLVQLLALTAAFALELNFQNIDYLMQRRGHKMSHLPGRIRYFNLILLGVGFALVLVLVLARGVLMQGVGTGLRALGGAFLYITGPLRRWWRDFDFSDREIDIPDLTPEDGEEPEQFEYDMEGGADTETQMTLLVVLFIAVALFLLYYFRRPILEALRAFWQWLCGALRSLLGGLGVRRRRFGQDENEYYTDVVEVLDASTGAQAAPNAALRDWRRALRAYQKLPPSREKYLHGYALSVRGLKLHGVKVSASDTPLEVLQKARQVLPLEGYAVATDCCNALAYDLPERAPAPAWEPLGRVLELLKNRKLGK